MTRLLIILFVWLLTPSAYATTASRPGGSGMTWMRTADTLHNGELVLYDQLGIDNYVILNSNLNDFDTFNTIGVNYGLFDPLELGLQTTWMANDQHSTSGIRSYKGVFKLRILGDKEVDNYAVTLSAFKTVSPADVNDRIGSGESEDGAEINASYYSQDLNIHLTLGSATSDAKYYNPDVIYYSVEKQYANLGLEFNVSDRFIFGIEAIQEQSDDPVFDKNQVFAFSLQYKTASQWQFDFGAAFGVPDDRSEPAESFYIGFNYLIDGKAYRPSGKKTTRAQTNIPVPKSRPPEKPAFSKRPPVKPGKSTSKKKSQKYEYRVRIKNGTGSTATAKRVAAFLKKNGYGVSSITTVSPRDKTEIRYLKQSSKQALRLALKIPGNQNLREMSKLGRGVDFELVIGSDIVQSIR